MKVTNGTGEPVDNVRLNYDLKRLWSDAHDDGSELPAYALFWSTTGETAAADWTKLGEDTAEGAMLWDLSLPTPLVPGADLYLRWADDNVQGPNGETAAENVWSLDNVRVTMSAIPEPGALLLLGAAGLCLLVYAPVRARISSAVRARL